MSNDISKIVEIIRKEVCADCKDKCGMCEHGVCQEVIIEIGCYFIHCAEKEKEQE